MKDDYVRCSNLLKLELLRSWTTIGTPFSLYLPENRIWSVRGWRHRSFLLSKARPSKALDLIFNAAASTLLTIAILFVWLAFSSDLWPAIGFAAAAFTLSGGATTSETRRQTARALTMRAIAARDVVVAFYDRWLGLWAPTDEAIFGARAMADPGDHTYEWIWTNPRSRVTNRAPADPEEILPIPFTFKAPGGATALAPDDIAWYGRLIWKRPVYFALNRYVGPVIRRKIAKVLLHAAQGSDVAGVELAYVNAFPVPIEAPIEGLPSWISAKLEERTRRQTGDLSVEARQIFAQVALETQRWQRFVTDVGKLSALTSGLLHTSYFDEPDVLRLVNHHIRRMQASEEGETGRTKTDLESWYEKRSTSISPTIDAISSLGQT